MVFLNEVMMRLLNLTVIILALSLLLTVPAVADEHDQEIEREDGDTEREIEIEQDTYSMSIESSFETEDGEREQEEEFSMSFEVEDEPSIELERSFENETATSEQENETSYEVAFTDIQALDTAGETVDEGYDLEDADFRPLNYTTRQSDGTTVHVIEAMTEDDVFGLRLYVAGDFADIEGESIGPQEVKIDIEIRKRSRDDGNVGLMTEVDSESESELEFEDGREIRERTRSSDSSAFFSWKETAMVDGERTDVTTETMQSDEDEHDIMFLYEPGSEIIHDPKIGFTTSGSGGGLLSWLWDLLFGWL